MKIKQNLVVLSVGFVLLLGCIGAPKPISGGENAPTPTLPQVAAPTSGDAQS